MPNFNGFDIIIQTKWKLQFINIKIPLTIIVQYNIAIMTAIIR